MLIWEKLEVTFALVSDSFCGEKRFMTRPILRELGGVNVMAGAPRGDRNAALGNAM